MVRHKMAREERAKQFTPFAALKGHMEALRQREKIIVEKQEFSDEYKEELDYRLRQVKVKDIVKVIYYCNGEYLQMTGMVSRINETARVLKIVGTKIRFDDLYDIQKEISQ